MKKLQYQDFKENDAWLICRLDTQIKTQSVDVYILLDLPSGMVLSHNLEEAGSILPEGARRFLNDGNAKKGRWPNRVLLGKGDPAEDIFTSILKSNDVKLELVPTPHLEDLAAPLKESFGQHFFSPSSVPYAGLEDDASFEDRETAKQFVPETYDPCPCASGKKYKFCCKPIFREIMGAMAEAERGRKKEALEWIQKAKDVAGETAEVLCREAIVYSFFDQKKMRQLLSRCLAQFPNHPRANYIHGIELRDAGDFQGAVNAYRRAVENYPKTDRYHLNETYNNLGTAYYELADYKGAKEAWEQGLVLLPSDRMVKNNLIEFIYSNPSVPMPLRKPSAFVERFLILDGSF